MMHFRKPIADPHEVLALRNLWMAVARAAILDVADMVNKTFEPRAKAVAGRMRYFHSRDWKLICEYAGISFAPDAIERFLLSDKSKGNGAEIYRNFGLVKGDA